MTTTTIEKWIVTVIVVATIGWIALIVIYPYFESKHYNKVTGAHTTYWDAVWLDLRVIDVPKERDQRP